MAKESKFQFDRSLQCFSCGKECSDSSIHFLERYGKEHTFHMTCAFCGSSAYVTENAVHSGIVRMGVMTDIVSEEVDRFMQKDPIGEDSVLDMYNFLKKEGSIRTTHVFEK